MFGGPNANGWEQVLLLFIAVVLGAGVGIEREVRQKSAGVRTHSLISLGAALFVLVSKFGFGDVLGAHVALDPSRVAAQIATGVGFIGGGLIFVNHDTVKGLTTAASVWVTAAVGAACGAALVVPATAAVALYLAINGPVRMIEQRAMRSHQRDEIGRAHV